MKLMMVRTSLKVVLAVLLIVAMIFLGLNPLMNLCSTNPIKADEEKDGHASQLFQTLSAYVETIYPQTRLYSIGEIEKKGFGKYEIPLCLGMRTQRTLAYQGGICGRRKDKDIYDEEFLSLWFAG